MTTLQGYLEDDCNSAGPDVLRCCNLALSELPICVAPQGAQSFVRSSKSMWATQALKCNIVAAKNIKPFPLLT